MKEIDKNTPVGEIVRINFNTSRIFDSRRIDFCCGGEKTLAEASVEADVHLKDLLDEITRALQQGDWDSRYLDGLSPGALCDYITDRHHGYLNENIPLIRQRLDKLCEVHGESHPELFRIRELFREGAGNLAMHMKKEELLLFPNVKKLFRALKGRSDPPSNAEELAEQIRNLEEEHRGEGNRFREIARITGGFQVPPDGCHTFEVTYNALHDMEQDLHKHIHLENNLLFPKIHNGLERIPPGS